MRQASSPFEASQTLCVSSLREATSSLPWCNRGGVATKIAENARRHAGTINAEMAEQLERARRVLTMPPEKAGEMIVRQVERRTPRVVIGGQAKMSALIERLAPVSYWKVLEALAR
jgi:hypothetical protein